MTKIRKFINSKQILSAYLTFGIPLLYLFNIELAFQYRYTFAAPFSVTVFGIILGVIGMILWVITYINLGRSFGILPLKQKRVTRGLYHYTNHPMYISIYLTFLGLSLANQSWQSLFFLNVILLPVLFVRGSLEEKKLI